MKDEFGEWQRKEVPPEAAELFKDWTRVNPTAEVIAIEWLDSNPYFFDTKEKVRGAYTLLSVSPLVL